MALHSAIWRRTDIRDGLAHGSLSAVEPTPEDPAGGHLLDGAAIVHGPEGGWSLRFSVVTDAGWRTRTTFVEVLSADGLERVTLGTDALGEWTLDGRPWPDLRGCTDVDVSASPVSNTMPILRLGLAVGAEASIEAAWLDVPSLAVHRVPQTYRRLPDDERGFATYTYADPHYGPFVLSVDAAGLVVDYQGLFTRVG